MISFAIGRCCALLLRGPLGLSKRLLPLASHSKVAVRVTCFATVVSKVPFGGYQAIAEMGKSKKKPESTAKPRPESSTWLLDPKLSTSAHPSGSLDRHDLYQKAVQSPAGDIQCMLKFFRQYVGLQVPLHLREDFSGTSLISATWCKSDVRRTALGVDIDREALEWGWRHNGQNMLGQAETQLCLVEANVLDDLAQYPAVGRPVLDQSSQEAIDPNVLGDHIFRPADIVCALNFSIFLLSSRQEVVRYLRLARAAMNQEDGSILVLDILGGHAGESSVKLRRHNEISGLSYLWEQAKFDPVKRQLTCHISLKDPQTSQVLKHAFTYHWKLWTIPEVVELLGEAGFADVHIWMRCMIGTDDSASDAGQDEVENDFEDYQDLANNSAMLCKLSKGWTAFIVAIIPPTVT